MRSFQPIFFLILFSPILSLLSWTPMTQMLTLYYSFSIPCVSILFLVQSTFSVVQIGSFWLYYLQVHWFFFPLSTPFCGWANPLRFLFQLLHFFSFNFSIWCLLFCFEVFYFFMCLKHVHKCSLKYFYDCCFEILSVNHICVISVLLPNNYLFLLKLRFSWFLLWQTPFPLPLSMVSPDTSWRT